jgi:HAD superfamily hydrolase (TIGR01509 family)
VLKAVIFDVDGVLIDSLEANVAIVQKLLVASGYPEPTRDQVLQYHHVPILITFQNLTGTTDLAEVARAKTLIEGGLNKEVRDLIRFPENLDDILEKLHKKYKLAIVTSRLRVGMDEIFSLKQMAHLFDVVITYEDVKNPKPHPEPLLLAAQKLGISPEEAIYIGDGPSDVESARDAGMLSIHLSHKPHADATSAIREFKELISAIEALL